MPAWQDKLSARRTELAFAAFVAVALPIAYWTMFRRFVTYDDEGTLLVSLAQFVRGDVLYRDVYSQYGPFYYELFGGFFALTGRHVSNDTGRLIVVAIAVATSVLLGLAAHRLTGRLLLGLAAACVAFSSLGQLDAEPMHPVGLCLLLLAAIVLAVTRAPGRRVVAGAALTGLAAGALVMTKINLGGFAIVAAGLAAALTLPVLARRPALRWAAIAGFAVLPWLLMAPDLDKDWVRDFAVLASIGGAAVAVAGLTAVPAPDAPDEGLGRWLVAAAAGAVVAGVASLAIIVATGPSLGDVYDGVIHEATRVRDALQIVFGAPPASADWAIAALAGAALAVALRRRASPGAPPGAGAAVAGSARVLAGVLIWFASTKSAPFGVGPSSAEPALPLALAWVAALAPLGAVETPFMRFARVFLPALAVAETLQAYPVAGTQVRAAALLYVPVGALCIADGLRTLEAWAATRPAALRGQLALVVTAVSAALLAKLAWGLVLRPGVVRAQEYASQVALPFEGANRVHLPGDQVATFERIAGILGARCDALVGYPSLNSFYFWAHIPPPRQGVPGAWMYLLDAEAQQRVVDELRAADRPCVLRHDRQASEWLQGRPLPDTPLVRYVNGGFRTIETVGEYQIQVPR